eukprot:CAMPEP_0171228826 /NCGR_PEP_ID=MMETSP0790-20130122/38567_1 /TAXON_ID=2925 /ORGANISM="Alexandrium catenella, Strain OF101" /LENGTH=267 /DNA_ID=CAMNT_0011694991 /DNA_START=60 /DNA_END=863 /DNA_ORIENTATION=-
MELKNLDGELATAVQEATMWSGEFDKLAASFMSGVSPDKTKARRVGGEIAQQGQKLKATLDELEGSADFQAREAYHTLEVMARRRNVVSMRAVEQLMNWQGQGLVAFADNRPLAPMPPSIDPQRIQGAAPRSPADQSIIEATLPNLLPFTESDFDAAEAREAVLLKGEFQRLCRDHKQLIGLGETFGGFDPVGKEFYLGQLEQIAFRWEELIDDAQRAGVDMNPAFVSMSKERLRRANMRPDEFRNMVEEVYDIFRNQAEKDKGIGS